MRKQIALLIAVLALAAGGCGDDGSEASATETTGPAPGGEASVAIESFAFAPAEITVPAGTTVTWTNEETGVPHTTTSDDGVWDSGTLEPGDTFSFTFDEAGTYPYSCGIHPSMTGTVVVEG